MAQSREPSRSRRSHTNLSNLRLAPLSGDGMPSFSASLYDADADADLGYSTHHSSYIQGRSAPSTPGILARSSSRRQLGGGLSRKLSLYETSVPAYAAVEVNRQGTPLNALRDDPSLIPVAIPKAKSEAALLVNQRRKAGLEKLHTQLSEYGSRDEWTRDRYQRRSMAGSGGARTSQKSSEDDWLTRAGLATTSLLRESKGQSWQSSSLTIDESTFISPADDEEAEADEDDNGLATSRRPLSRGGPSTSSSYLRLNYADDELSPDTPRQSLSLWGSRFGSRVPSARNSRRGSRADLLLSPTQEHDRFARYSPLAEREREQDNAAAAAAIGPDFVDMDDAMEEDAEQEIARLARERSFGLGGLVDRLVGWTLFNVDEDREATDVEDERSGDGLLVRRTENNSTPRSLPARNIRTEALMAASSSALTSDTATSSSRNLDGTATTQEEGGWQDAAWLLSLASKVIL